MASLRETQGRESVRNYSAHYFNKEIYVKELTKLTTSVNKFLNILTEALKRGPI
jgi:hypothetical protein